MLLDFRPRLPLLLLLVVIMLTPAACGTEQPEAAPEPEEIPFEIIGRGRNAQMQDTTETRISDANTWQAYADSLSPLGPLSDVDFAERDVLLIAVPVTSGGYDVSIDRIQQQDGQVQVHYLIEAPGEDCLVAQVLLTPFVAAATEKSDNDMAFIATTDEYSCGVRERG